MPQQGVKAPVVLTRQEYSWQHDKVAQDSHPAMLAVKTKKKKKKSSVNTVEFIIFQMLDVPAGP